MQIEPHVFALADFSESASFLNIKVILVFSKVDKIKRSCGQRPVIGKGQNRNVGLGCKIERDFNKSNQVLAFCDEKTKSGFRFGAECNSAPA